MWYIMWYIMYIMLYISVGYCMVVWCYCMDILCYVDMILYCVWGCNRCLILSAVVRLLFGLSRWFYYVQMVLLCYINVVLNTIYYEQSMNNICMIYVLFMDRLWIYNSEWIMNIMYKLCIKYEQIMNKSK